MSSLTFWQFLSLDSEQLVAMGVPRREVVDRRFAATGHVRPIGRRWFPTFGGWGGVLDLDELGDRIGADRQEVKDYAKAKGLRYATREHRRTHSELALLLWCDRDRAPEESCRRLGVYPGERRILCAAAQVLVDRVDGGIEAVLRWTLAELDARFAELDVVISPPRHLLQLGALTPVARADLDRRNLARRTA